MSEWKWSEEDERSLTWGHEARPMTEGARWLAKKLRAALAELARLQMIATAAEAEVARVELPGISVGQACGVLIEDAQPTIRNVRAHWAIWHGETYDVLVRKADGLTVEETIRGLQAERDRAVAELTKLQGVAAGRRVATERLVDERTDLRNKLAAQKREIARLQAELARREAEHRNLLGWLEGPLRTALRHARPRADSYDLQHVTVEWITGVDMVRRLLAKVDATPPTPAPEKIKITLDDEARLVWETAQAAKAEVASWSPWKRGDTAPYTGGTEDYRTASRRLSPNPRLPDDDAPTPALGKLTRDESTPEKAEWWRKVGEAAASAPKLTVAGPAAGPTDGPIKLPVHVDDREDVEHPDENTPCVLRDARGGVLAEGVRRHLSRVADALNDSKEATELDVEGAMGVLHEITKDGWPDDVGALRIERVLVALCNDASRAGAKKERLRALNSQAKR
jgi:hypothetical protein